MRFFNVLFRSLFVLLLSIAMLHAADYSDIQLLIKEKKYEQALKMTDGQLSLNPDDIKLQFLKGLTLTRLDRLQEAESVFLNITKVSPELPEPYNNLAVVYAAQGKYSEAEQALKDAINTHPSYATAHENLGDIYAKMASRAYNQALELDTTNYSARAKLSLVNELISEPGGGQTKPAEVEQVAAAPTAAPVSKPKPIPTEPEIITIPVKKEPAPKAQEKVIPPVPPAPRQPQVASADEELRQNRQRVEQAVQDWARAWSNQDVDAYLASYADEFVPGDNQSLSNWKQARKIRLRRPAYIKIGVSDMKVNLHGKDYAEVRFRQQYQSNTYGDIVSKELLMRKYGDKWLITQERTR